MEGWRKGGGVKDEEGEASKGERMERVRGEAGGREWQERRDGRMAGGKDG